MKLNTSDLFLLCQLAISAARQAGQIISDQHPESITVKYKNSGNSLASQVVTEVDQLCQDRILQLLNPSCQEFDLALLTEETPDDFKRLEKDFFWCIDPLDGTLSFIESTPGYAVSIALVSRQGIPQIGVIYDPVEQVLYHSIKGQGAFRNNQSWTIAPSNSATKQSLTLIADRSFKQHALYSETIAELTKTAKEMGYIKLATPLYGGAVMNACWVLEKAPACYFKLPKPENGGGSLWDYAASVCLYLEAGAVVSDLSGKALDLNRPDSCFMNHRGVLFASHALIAKQVLAIYADLGKQQ